MGVSSLPKTATRQYRGCDLNPGPSESSTLTTPLPSHPIIHVQGGQKTGLFLTVGKLATFRGRKAGDMLKSFQIFSRNEHKTRMSVKLNVLSTVCINIKRI